MTLVELLAAMLVLLVGVYSVAALFPKLFRNIQHEEARTEIVRLAEQTAERFQTGADQAPDDTAPLDSRINLVDPSALPKDPDTTSPSGNPLNARDDFIVVHGERFRVPAPAEGGKFPCYVPKCGLLAEADLASLMIVQLKELEPAMDDPGSGGTPPAGRFYLRPDGQFLAATPIGWPAPDWYEIEYNWYDDNGTPGTGDDLIKRVPGEAVGVGVIVQAARAPGAGGRGGRVISSSARCRAAYRWWPNMGSPGGWGPPPQARDVLVDVYAGQALYFPLGATGAELRMDYRVRHTGAPNYRRDLILQEDATLPNRPPYEIRLSAGNLDDANPLLTRNFQGAALARPVFLMMVDLTDGTPLVWDGTVGAIASVDFTQGVVNLDPTAPVLQGRLGNRVRIYYRTMDQHLIQVQKAPAEFVEVNGAVASDVPAWAHRTFRVGKDSSGNNYTGSGVNTLLYAFPLYCEGQVVQVDYLVQTSPTLPPKRISNEIHVIKDIGPAYGFGFLLDEPNVVGVLAVRGASMKVTGWWRSETGMVSRVDTTNILFGGLM